MPKEFNPKEILSLPLMANLATVERDGSPRNAPTWFIWEDGAIWLLGTEGNSSIKRIQSDPRCAIEIVNFDNVAGVLLHLGLRGSATIEPMSASRFRRLLKKYLGDEKNWNAWFIANIARIDDPEGRLIRMEPREVFTNNVSYFRTGPDLAWPESSDGEAD